MEGQQEKIQYQRRYKKVENIMRFSKMIKIFEKI